VTGNINLILQEVPIFYLFVIKTTVFWDIAPCRLV
jgi:hypothetical protein